MVPKVDPTLPILGAHVALEGRPRAVVQEQSDLEVGDAEVIEHLDMLEKPHIELVV